MKFTQLPGTLDVEIVVGDEVAMSVDFDRDITGYQLQAPIFVTESFVIGVGGATSGAARGTTVENWAISVIDAQAGTIALGLSESQTENLPVGQAYRWYLRWSDTSQYTRTVLSGSLVTREP